MPVQYSSVEEATATRNALFNLQWPPQGGRLLTAEFVDPSEVKLRSDGEKAAATTTATAAPSTNAITPRGALSANSKASKDGSTVPSSGQPSTPGAGLLPPPPPLPFSPRDRPKQGMQRSHFSLSISVYSAWSILCSPTLRNTALVYYSRELIFF